VCVVSLALAIDLAGMLNVNKGTVPDKYFRVIKLLKRENYVAIKTLGL